MKTPMRFSAARTGWAYRLWVIACVLLGLGLVFLAAPARDAPRSAQTPKMGGLTPVHQSVPSAKRKRIEDVRVGERVPGQNPTGDFDHSLGDEVDRATWRKLELRAPKRDGSYADVVLLRPQWWIEERQARVGRRVLISVPECGIDGNAEVLSVGPCPEIESGEGRVVIGTFAHQSAAVMDLYVEGLEYPIGVTANHPFWSDDRQDFVAAGELQIGERLHGIANSPRITAISPRGPPQPVFNIEVHGEHAYQITLLGIAVHNAVPINPCPGNGAPSSRLSVRKQFARMGITTSSTSKAPSRTYTIYKANGEVFKFGVTDANLVRYNQSLKMAGPGSYGKFTRVVPKYQAHLQEKYLRSLHYSSTGQWSLPGMTVPHPVDFNTGTPIHNPNP